jgi:pimeloyl-[acyl-carrier protein] methyl ester esterase
MGERRDVVLLHGWAMTARVWKDFAARLEPRYRVHAPDLPGYGTAQGCEARTLAALAAVLARAAPARCQVVGWSLGGQVALAWARAAPQQVTRLALIGVTPCFVQRADWPHAVAADVLAAFSAGLDADTAGTLRRFVSLQAQDDEQERNVARQLRIALASGAGPALADGLRLLQETDLRDELGSIRQPALVLHGDRDRLVPPAAADYLSRRLPAAWLTAVRGAAHAPFLSRPAEVAAAVEEFFGA